MYYAQTQSQQSDIPWPPFARRAGGLLIMAAAAGSLLLLAAASARAASVKEDANGFVVLEAENFDLNVTQDGGAWQFDNTPLTWSGAGSGWGYMKGVGAGGTNMSTSPHLDYNVKFNFTGPHYLWVLGSDAGSKELHMGLDGVVTTNSINIGGEDGAFGTRNAGMWLWIGTNNAGSPLRWVNKSYLNVPSTVDHAVNVFIAGSGGLYVDKIVLTTDINWAPSPLYDQYTVPNGAANGGAANIPTPSIVGSPLLSVAMTQPATGKTFVSNTTTVVVLAAKAVTNGNFSISKIEFFAQLQPSGANTKLGEATAPPYMYNWVQPAVGTYNVTAKVTDSGARVATSPVVTVAIAAPPSYTTPLIWTTNTFDTGLGSWTAVFENHAGAFNLDWTNSSFAGGTPGEFGGRVVRMATLAPYVGEPLARHVSMNEELWFRGRAYCRNYGPDGPTDPERISANADVFLGYFDSTVFGNPPRLGFKIREPNSTYPTPGDWRLWYGRGGAEVSTGWTAAETNAFEFQFHWIPSGNGDGSGTFEGWLFNPANSFSVSYGASTITFDTFGYVSPAQGSDEPWRQQDHYFDDLQYVVPAMQQLQIALLDSTKALLSWAIPDHILQFANGAVPTYHTNATWVDIDTNLVVNVGGKYYYTNAIAASPRWFQLRHPLP